MTVQHSTLSVTKLGFWTYLMTDCLMFTTLFATYAVMQSSTFGGPSSKDLFHLNTAFIETILLLCSTFTCGIAIQKPKQAIRWLMITFLLGATFLSIELTEFHELVKEGNGWDKSAFLSSFFTLVGTHGAHIFVGLLWILVMIGQLFFQGITENTTRRLILFTMYWHFLDLIWIFIFTFVYLMGVM